MGESIKPLVPEDVSCLINLFINGIKNAAVFPDPVLAIAIKSFPAKVIGNVYIKKCLLFSEQGLGIYNPFSILH